MPSGDGRVPDKNGLVPPQLLDAERVKKVYPPLQWRPLRVMNPWHKLVFLVGWVAAGFLVSWLLGLMLSPVIAPFISIPLDLVAQVALARSFRGVGEPVQPPRLWWRLTAHPLAGWWISPPFTSGDF